MAEGIEVFLIRTLPRRNFVLRRSLKLNITSEKSRPYIQSKTIPTDLLLKHVYCLHKHRKPRTGEECWYFANNQQLSICTRLSSTEPPVMSHYKFPQGQGIVTLQILTRDDLVILSAFSKKLMVCRLKAPDEVQVICESNQFTKYKIMPSEGDCVSGAVELFGDNVLYLDNQNSLCELKLDSFGNKISESVYQTLVQVFCVDRRTIYWSSINCKKIVRGDSAGLIRESADILCQVANEQMTHMYSYKLQLLVVTYNTTLRRNQYSFVSKSTLCLRSQLTANTANFSNGTATEHLHVQKVEFIARPTHTVALIMYRAEKIELLLFTQSKHVLAGCFELTKNILHDLLVISKRGKQTLFIVGTAGPITSRLWKLT